MNPTATALLAISIAFPILSFAFCLLRLLARRVRSTPLMADDWVIFLAQIFCFSLGVNTIIGVSKGVFGVPQKQLDPVDAVILLKVVYGDSFLCFSSLAVVKIGVLLFYKRVFSVKSFFLAANIMIGVTVAWFTASFFGLLFSQWPISSHWNLSAPLQTHRIDFAAFLLTHASLDLVLDIVILCLPVPMIINLHMDRRSKFALIGIFWLGAFCAVAEAVRIYYLHLFLYSDLKNHADAFGPVVANVLNWSRIEPCCSVIAACLPTLRPVFNSRGPQSIVASVRSAISLGSINSRGSNNNTKKSNIDSNPEESRRDWTRLQNGSGAVDDISITTKNDLPQKQDIEA